MKFVRVLIGQLSRIPADPGHHPVTPQLIRDNAAAQPIWTRGPFLAIP